MIREYSRRVAPVLTGKYIICHHEQFVQQVAADDGHVFLPRESLQWQICRRIRFVCDTAEEAESVRKLLEAEREEIEAVRRRYEQQLTAMVSP